MFVLLLTVYFSLVIVVINFNCEQLAFPLLSGWVWTLHCWVELESLAAQTWGGTASSTLPFLRLELCSGFYTSRSNCIRLYAGIQASEFLFLHPAAESVNSLFVVTTVDLAFSSISPPLHLQFLCPSAHPAAACLARIAHPPHCFCLWTRFLSATPARVCLSAPFPPKPRLL